jgi:hypothetical protein
MTQPLQHAELQDEARVAGPSEHGDRRSIAQDISDAMVGL